MLWFIFVLMTAAAIFAVLWPLSRRDNILRSGSDLAVYRDQLAEIDHDLEAGLIAAPEAEAARLEVSRRLLAAAEHPDDMPASQAAVPATGALRRRRAVALVALVLIPLGSAALYLAFGSPHMPGMPVAARDSVMPETRSLAGMVEEVEAHLAKNPDDSRGWEVLAPIYMRISRFEDAIRARRNLLRLQGSDAVREGDLGEALVGAAGGMVTADAKAAFERALSFDAADVRARYFIGLAAEQDGRRDEAARIWRKMVAEAPAEAPYLPLLQAALARVDPAARPQNGPSAEDMDAAAQMSFEERREMIRGMVERLSERLKADESDLEGWVRLMRAYVVLGERDKALAALTNARRIAGKDAEKHKVLEDVAAALGLKS